MIERMRAKILSNFTPSNIIPLLLLNPEEIQKKVTAQIN